MPTHNPYVGYNKDARGVKNLWERFHSGLVTPGQGHSAYEDLLLNDWQRCTALGVDTTITMARRLAEDEYIRLEQANRRLIDSAVPIIEDVGRFLDNVPGLMLLADHSGCVLHIAGQAQVRDMAACRSGIVEGSKWDESSAGTNGMGTALVARQPVHVFATEHYCEGWQAWSCAAAPIFDADGTTVLGIIDFTTVQSEHRDQGLALCVSMANSISARMALYRALDRSRLTTAFNDAARHYPHDDIIALDTLGRVVSHAPTERCRRIAENWSGAGDAAALVRETVDVPAPDTGMSIGKVILLSRPAGYDRVFAAATRDPRLDEAVEPVRQFGQFVSRDPATRRMLDELERVALTDVNLLITGETGTGKELLARQVHACSPRRAEPYLALNCGAISAELIESTFFGYVRGAFSGADPRGRAGYFESAQGGTLFLDEVGELPLPTQAALLRVLEDGSFSRVGSCQTLRSRCRIIAATHRDLAQRVSEGRFREDLYFRLKIVHKRVKPLRERRCDVVLLIDRFVEAVRGKYGLPAAGFTREARDVLESYRWPGNAREVRNVVEAAMVCNEGTMGVDCLPPELLRPPEPAAVQPQGEDLQEATRAYERQLVVGLLRKYGKVNAVAKALGIARSTLYRKFAELGVDQSQYKSGPGG